MTHTHNEIGMKVMAVRNVDGKAYVFGEGTYVGDLVRPGEMDDLNRKIILSLLEDEDRAPAQESLAVQVTILSAQNQGWDEEKTREAVQDVIAEVEKERAQPLEQRIATTWTESRRNPCIHLEGGLNDGRIVWGFQCWWGDIEGFNASPVASFEREFVPVPEENGWWKQND